MKKQKNKLIFVFAVAALLLCVYYLFIPMWDYYKVKNSSSIEPILYYLKKYPASQHSQKMRNKLFWLKCQKDKTAKSLLDYLIIADEYYTTSFHQSSDVEYIRNSSIALKQLKKIVNNSEKYLNHFQNKTYFLSCKVTTTNFPSNKKESFDLMISNMLNHLGLKRSNNPLFANFSFYLSGNVTAYGGWYNKIGYRYRNNRIIATLKVFEKNNLVFNDNIKVGSDFVDDLYSTIQSPSYQYENPDNTYFEIKDAYNEIAERINKFICSQTNMYYYGDYSNTYWKYFIKNDSSKSDEYGNKVREYRTVNLDRLVKHKFNFNSDTTDNSLDILKFYSLRNNIPEGNIISIQLCDLTDFYRLTFINYLDNNDIAVTDDSWLNKTEGVLYYDEKSLSTISIKNLNEFFLFNYKIENQLDEEFLFAIANKSWRLSNSAIIILSKNKVKRLNDFLNSSYSGYAKNAMTYLKNNSNISNTAIIQMRNMESNVLKSFQKYFQGNSIVPNRNQERKDLIDQVSKIIRNSFDTLNYKFSGIYGDMASEVVFIQQKPDDTWISSIRVNLLPPITVATKNVNGKLHRCSISFISEQVFHMKKDNIIVDDYDSIYPKPNQLDWGNRVRISGKIYGFDVIYQDTTSDLEIVFKTKLSDIAKY